MISLFKIWCKIDVFHVLLLAGLTVLSAFYFFEVSQNNFIMELCYQTNFLTNEVNSQILQEYFSGFGHLCHCSLVLP
mgnify:CR=1 FL=1|tara:strand:- start:259 stop:489 length:231 start_codon:yes stop_codon:yes gene_type:complete